MYNVSRRMIWYFRTFSNCVRETKATHLQNRVHPLWYMCLTEGRLGTAGGQNPPAACKCSLRLCTQADGTLLHLWRGLAETAGPVETGVPSYGSHKQLIRCRTCLHLALVLSGHGSSRDLRSSKSNQLERNPG